MINIGNIYDLNQRDCVKMGIFNVYEPIDLLSFQKSSIELS